MTRLDGDEQIDRLIDRLEPIADRIAALVRVIDESEEEGFAFRHSRWCATSIDEMATGSTSRWHLDRRALKFLHHTGVELAMANRDD